MKIPGQFSVEINNRVLSLTATSYHKPLDTTSGPMRVTSGKSRVRESRLPGSVRAKPYGQATRPFSLCVDTIGPTRQDTSHNRTAAPPIAGRLNEAYFERSNHNSLQERGD